MPVSSVINGGSGVPGDDRGRERDGPGPDPAAGDDGPGAGASGGGGGEGGEYCSLFEKVA